VSASLKQNRDSRDLADMESPVGASAGSRMRTSNTLPIGQDSAPILPMSSAGGKVGFGHTAVVPSSRLCSYPLFISPSETMTVLLTGGLTMTVFSVDPHAARSKTGSVKVSFETNRMKFSDEIPCLNI
jgi:hypothetical protein